MPPSSGAAWAGPYQSQSAVLRFTGTLLNSVAVILPRPGFWIVENLCTVGSFVVVLGSVTYPANEFICAPPGEAVHIYCDGTNVRFVDFGRVGSYLDLATTSIPLWIAGCTKRPYLNCDGTTFSGTTYPALASLLGGTTLPDLRGRSRIALDQGTGRVTTAGSGVDGTTLLAAGGAQNQTILQANFPNIQLPVTDPKHSHAITPSAATTVAVFGPSGSANNLATAGANNTQPAATGITVSTGGSGTPLTTVPPVQVSGLTLIRAA